MLSLNNNKMKNDKPIIPPKPKFIIDKINNVSKLVAAAADEEYNLSQNSHYSELNDNNGSNNDAYSLLDEIYAEIEDKNLNQLSKSTITTPSSSQPLFSSSSSSSSSSSYSSSDYCNNICSNMKPPPLPAQPPPRLIYQDSSKYEIPLSNLDKGAAVKLCELAFNEPNDYQLNESSILDEDYEENYLEPINIDLINEIKNVNNNIAESNTTEATATKQLRKNNLFSTVKLTNTLKLIRTKSLSTATPDLNQNRKSIVSQLNFKSIEISAPTLISQTFDITKQNFIQINNNSTIMQHDDSSTSSSSSFSVSSFESQSISPNKKSPIENGNENNNN